MCTAFDFSASGKYFGRNLDWSESYGERVVIVPRNFKITFKKEKAIKTHYAIMGMAITAEDYPLFYDAQNEKGIAVAGLNFPKSARYNTAQTEMRNVAPYELPLWLLAQAESLDEAKRLLRDINIIDEPFSDTVGVSPMHWMVSDGENAIVIEPTARGVMVYDNNLGVLTNEPPFPEQSENLSGYDISDIKDNSFSGDSKSKSRFVRGAFMRKNAFKFEKESENIAQFFHLLSSVQMVKGTVEQYGKLQYTIYSACMSLSEGVYYYKRYESDKLNEICLYDYNLDSCELIG